MSDLSRLIYCSRKKEADQGSHAAMDLSILDISSAINSRNNVTGALLSSPSHFFQVLEGSFHDITATMSRIRQDSRHDQIELLQVIPAETRFFSGWTMSVISLQAPSGSLTADLLERVHTGDRRFVSVLQVVAFKLSPKAFTTKQPGREDATPQKSPHPPA